MVEGGGERERERERVFVCTASMILGVVFYLLDRLITECLFSHLYSNVAPCMLWTLEECSFL